MSNFEPYSNGEYNKCCPYRYLTNDLPSKVCFGLHLFLEDGALPEGIFEDKGKQFDLCTNSKEWELSHNLETWKEQGEFPFDFFQIQTRKHPELYSNPNLESYYVQFREDFELAQVVKADLLKAITPNGVITAKENTRTIRIHPTAQALGFGLWKYLTNNVKKSGLNVQKNKASCSSY